MKRLKLLIILVFLSGLFAQSQNVDFIKLDAYFEKAAADWGIPGMSIGIVKDGEIVFSKGYGVLEVGKPEKPDGNTLYAIASNSKAFTSAIIAMLVQEGKLNWDDKYKNTSPNSSCTIHL
jgi:CubicO group peptidase (beta-lactamase class C family)